VHISFNSRGSPQARQPRSFLPNRDELRIATNAHGWFTAKASSQVSKPQRRSHDQAATAGEPGGIETANGPQNHEKSLRKANRTCLPDEKSQVQNL